MIDGMQTYYLCYKGSNWCLLEVIYFLKRTIADFYAFKIVSGGIKA